jgi:O-antigen/teichoic acid export membrane protein
MRVAYALPSLIRPLSMIGGGALLALWIDTSLTATEAVVIAGCPALLVWLLQRWAFRRQLPDAFEQASSVYESRHWLQVAFPMFLVTGFALLLNKTDLLMIGLMADPKEVGLYKVATKTASLILFPLSAISTVTAPRIAKLYENQKQKELQELVSTAARWMFGGSLIVAFGLLLSSEFLLGLFGPAFLQSKPILWILVGGLLANAVSGSVVSLLSMTGHQNESAKVYGACVLLNVGLNAIGISMLGTIGAAIATVVSTVLLNGGLYRLVVLKLNLYPSVFDTLRSSKLS